MSTRAPQPAAPVRTDVLRTRPEDWILAGVFALFPLVGLMLDGGDAFALAGVGVLLWVGNRVPLTPAARDGHRAAGIAVLLVMLCLLLPQLELASVGTGLPGFELTRVIRLALALVLLVALLRGRLPERGWMRVAELATLVGLLIAVGLMAKLWSSGQEAAFRVLVEVTLSLVIVFGVHRAHLLRSEALSLLARSALLGVVGALVVAALR